MPRSRRIDFPGAHHHVFNRGANRQDIFLSDADRAEFGRLLGEAHDHFGVEVLAYCLMGNHYHLLLKCPEAGLSQAMHRISFVFTQHVNERHQRDGPLFRGRFASIPVLDDAYLLTTFRYIHRNALAIDGVEAVDEYRWSSHRTYLGHRDVPRFMTIDHLLDRFGGDRARLHDFIASERRGRLSTASLDETIAVAKLVATVAPTDDDRRARLLRSTLTALLDLAPPSLAAELEIELGAPSARTRRRVRQRCRQDHLLAEVVSAASDELGFDAVRAAA